MDSTIKIIEIKKIPINKIHLGTQIRQTQLAEGLELLAENIRKVGLIQPVVVFPTTGDGYEIIVGQRRFLTHKDILKFSEIHAMVIEKPEDAAAILSFFGGTQRNYMSRKDVIQFITHMYAQKTSIKEIATILAIPPKQV
ncbi:MAG: ParB N-terminal domain-containing protein, partial [Nitrosopumilus sp.]|nr:ParB N-terminal domain-containing protein [Nitrosopumilus sp.]